MKLSKEAEDYARSVVDNRCETLLSNLQEELRHTPPGTGIRARMMEANYIECINEMARVVFDTYTGIYRTTKSNLTLEDIEEIVAEINRLGNEAVEEISNTVLTDNIDSIVSIFRKELILEMKKMYLERAEQKESSVDFTFIADPEVQRIIERDYAELQNLDSNKTPKSVLVISGGIIEGLLCDAIITSGYWSTKEANERFLKDMIYPSKSQGIVQHDNLSEVLRVFRNLIHPAREIRDKLVFDESHANHARAAVEVIISEVRSWYASRKP